MILKIYNGEYSLQWDRIYYLALIDYPNIQLVLSSIFYPIVLSTN